MFRGNWKAALAPKHYRGIGEWFANQRGTKSWKFDPEQPRDDSGRWSATGGGLDTSHLTGGKAPKGLDAETVRANMQGYVDRAKEGGTFEEDKVWYETAHAAIGERAATLNVDPQTFAGMVAATSPRCTWDTSTGRLLNIDFAARAVETARAFPGQSGPEVVANIKESGGSFGMMSNSLSNAIDVYNGHTDEALTGPKVSSFNNNLVWPTSSNDVTVDGNQARAMAGAAGSDANALAKGSYGWAADQVRAAASDEGLQPLQYQAVVWAQWRREQ